MTDGFGSITWWGFSPAIDFQDKDLGFAFENLSISEDEDETLNILVIGMGDSRNILKTICQSHRWKRRKLNFYVLENNLELYARHLLFLTIALEPQTRMGLQDKTEIFLELFGNSMVRHQSLEYVEKMSNLFIKFVTDFDFLEKKMPLIDMSLLKFKERDFLEGIFKFWRNPDRSMFDMEKCWDLRLRNYLGTRYDAIPNVFDWDYHMKLSERGAGVITSKRYGNWRHHGMAFEIREGTYDKSNKTMASGLVFKKDGERLARRGYWGDILISPYIAYGIECVEKSFFKKNNHNYMQCSEQVAEFNVLSMFHELAHKKEYSLPKTDTEENKKPETEKATLTEITEEEEEENEAEEPEKSEEERNPLDTEYEPIDVSYAKVYFLPLSGGTDLPKKSKYHKLFNEVYIGNSMVHLLNEDLSTTFADKASVILETTKFMLDIKKEQSEEFIKKIKSLAEMAGCKMAAPCKEDKDAIAKFIYHAKS